MIADVQRLVVVEIDYQLAAERGAIEIQDDHRLLVDATLDGLGHQHQLERRHQQHESGEQTIAPELDQLFLDDV